MIDSNERIPNSEGENFKIKKKLVLLEERKQFLVRCKNSHVLLPSNHRKNVDFDLMLIQQNRRLKKDFMALKQDILKLRNSEKETVSKYEKKYHDLLKLRPDLSHF